MRNKATWMVLMLTIALLGTPVLGQRTTATLYGIVQDPTGGVVPGASIELTNEQTSTKVSVIAPWRGLTTNKRPTTMLNVANATVPAICQPPCMLNADHA